MAQKPAFVKNALMPLSLFSLSERSGWRSVSEARIAQLADIFRAGQFGQSVACAVQVLDAEDADGKALIDDGVSTVTALLRLQDEHERGMEVSDAALQAVFKDGLRVTVVSYQDNADLGTRRAWNVGKHDEEANTVRWSSVHLKIVVAKDLYGQHGDWAKVAKELQSRFGFSASTTKRWSRAATGIDPEILALLGTPDFERIKVESGAAF